MEEKLLPEYTRSGDDSIFTVALLIAGCLMFVALVVGMAVILVAVSYVLYQVYADVTDPPPRPEMFATVDGCHGLGAARVPRACNLTVAVDNRGGRYDVRVGGDAVVLYGGVPLATGLVERLRVPPHGAAEVAVRAASGGLGLPGELPGMMAEEMKRAGGGGVVQLELRVLSRNRSDTSLMCTANLNLDGGASDVPAPSPCERLVLRDESEF